MPRIIRTFILDVVDDSRNCIVNRLNPLCLGGAFGQRLNCRVASFPEGSNDWAKQPCPFTALDVFHVHRINDWRMQPWPLTLLALRSRI